MMPLLSLFFRPLLPPPPRPSMFFLLSFLLSLIRSSSAFSPGGYSPGGFVYRCPMMSMAPMSYLYPQGGISYCGTGSIFHYYVCCDYNPAECCLQLETWVIIALVVVGLLALLGCLGCCAVCLIMQKR